MEFDCTLGSKMTKGQYRAKLLRKASKRKRKKYQSILDEKERVFKMFNNLIAEHYAPRFMDELLKPCPLMQLMREI